MPHLCVVRGTLLCVVPEILFCVVPETLFCKPRCSCGLPRLPAFFHPSHFASLSGEVICPGERHLRLQCGA